MLSAVSPRREAVFSCPDVGNVGDSVILKLLIPIVCSAFLASCSTKFVDIRPPDELDTKPIAAAVEDSGKAVEKIDAAVKDVRKATNEVSAANAKVSELTIRLKGQMARSQSMASGNAELQASLAASDSIIEELSKGTANMSSKIVNLEFTVSTLEAGNEGLAKANHILATRLDEVQRAKEKQDKQIADTGEKLLEASKLQPKIDILEDKLHFWHWRFLPASIAIVALLTLFIIYRPRIPFIS